MSKASKFVYLFIVAVAALGSVSSASAQLDSGGNLFLPPHSTTYFGMVWGTAATVSQRQDGSCLLMFMSSSGGLQRLVTAHGTTGAEDLRVFSWDVSFCGYLIQPLVTNGFNLSVVAGAGNDRLENYVPGVILSGQAGNDVVAQWEGFANGGIHRDWLYCDAGDTLNGAEGDDSLSVASGTARLVNGGDGQDSLCGNARDSVSIETLVLPIGGGC